MLFVLVGAAVEISVLRTAGLLAVLLILASIIFRMLAVIVCLYKTKLNFKEKIFACISYLPKATVQAAIGAIPLSLGMPAGSLILTISVLSIFISAPLGAIGMDRLNIKLLKVDNT